MTILITGASGNLGRKLHRHLAGSYALRLLDINPRGDDRIIKADFSTWRLSWVRHFMGVDTVVHLAADPNPTRSWQEMLRPNFDTFAHVFNAAVQGGAKRIIFASSNHVMGGYRDNNTPQMLQEDTPPLPGLIYGENEQYDTTPYGAFKLAAERLGKCYADIHDISFIGVRIGYIKHDDNSAANFRNENAWGRQMWLSDRDYCQLMQCCIEADSTLRFAIVNGMSANAGMRWDIEEARRLVGYQPQDGWPD
ncbi:MAG: NAD(P)-dependent oxidoreductase [Chloroflexota bacterium]